MDFYSSVWSGFKRIVDFDGRSSRSEYWFFFLFFGLCSIAAFGFDAAFLVGGKPLFEFVISLVFFLPSMSLQWRRLQDINLAGWISAPLITWSVVILLQYLSELESGRADDISMLEFASLFILMPYLLLGCVKGTNGTNKYGHDPLIVADTGIRSAQV